MVALVKKRSGKAGLPPGSLVHIGKRRGVKPAITLIRYDEAGFEESKAAGMSECFPLVDEGRVTWINVEGVDDPDTVRQVGEQLGLHPLVLEDILNTEQRPKLEDYGGYLYIVLRMLSCPAGTGGILSEQVSLVLGPNYVISFQEGIEGDVFDPLRERIRTAGGQVRKSGADYLAYRLIDSVVDGYFSVLERLEDTIDSLEGELLKDPGPGTIQSIHNLKREMIFLRKSVWPLREVVSSLERGESSLIRESTGVYLRDVYDHALRIIDSEETLRDILSGMLDIYLSSVSTRLNSVMKTLTIIATIFMPLTFLAGVYGMNFRFMPELEWRLGYPVFWSLIVLIGIGMFIYFRRKKWL